MKRYMLVLLGLFIGIINCGRKNTNTMNAVEERYTVQFVDLLDKITQTGEVQPLIKMDLQSEASGRIEKVYVKEGQKVTKGDKILDIDPDRLLFTKERMDLAIKKARIQLEIARRNYEDARKLMTTGTVSAKTLSDLKSEFEVSEITYEQQLLELNDIEDQLNKTRVTSPIDGVITSLDVEEGEIAVSPTSGFQSGTALATIADISQLEIVSQIGEVDYIHLKQGQKVIIKPEAIENVHTTGTIDFIALSAKKSQPDELGTFEVRILVDSLIAGIAPGITVNVEFVILEKKTVLGIPNRYVQKGPKGYSVSKILEKEDGSEEVVRVPVTVGATDYVHYQILSGLEEGDIVLFKDNIQQGRRKNK